MNITEMLLDYNVREANISTSGENRWNVIWKDADFKVHESILHDSDLFLPKGVTEIATTKMVKTYSASEFLVDEMSINARIIILRDETEEIIYVSISKTADPALEDPADLLHILEGKKNILFVGATGSGKTHLLNQFLHHHLPKDETYFLIEEFEEINLPSILHKIHRTIPFAEPGDFLDYGPYFLNEANTSRVSGVIYGECKTPSVAEGLMMAANNGTAIYSTIHASDSSGAVHKLASLIFPNMSLEERLKMVAKNIDCIVHLVKHEINEIAYPTGAVVNNNVQMKFG